MDGTPEIELRERERAALLEEATRIVRTAEVQSTGLTAEEDGRVLELMARVRSLEEEIGHLKRHEEEGDPARKRNKDQP
jgi:hypothetical protein